MPSSLTTAVIPSPMKLTVPGDVPGTAGFDKASASCRGDMPSVFIRFMACGLIQGACPNLSS